MMAFWDADFTTRMGAETTIGQAALACFILAGFRIVAAMFLGGTMGFDTPQGQIVAALTGLEALIAMIAGFRFRAGRGAYWGIATAGLLALSILNSLLSMAIGGAIISGIFLVVVVQGIRGALALRKSAFDEDDLEAFE